MSFDQPIADSFAAQKAPNGEAVDAREVRRMDRLGELEQLRGRAGRISARLCDAIEGNPLIADDDPLRRLPDPVLAFTRVATAIRRIVALEEQLDEDAETRETRLNAELEKRAKAMAAGEVARKTAEFENKIRVHRHVTRKMLRDDIQLRDGEMSRARRELLLNDLTSDLEDLDYISDPIDAICRIRRELDAILGPPPKPDDTSRTTPARRNWEPASPPEITALMLQSIDSARRKLGRMADG